MSARLLLLDLLDPRGHRGLAAGVRAANAFGVEAIPIATGIVTGAGDATRVLPVRARLLAAALREAFEERIDGMLIGPVPDFWQSRALARALSDWLPDTLVYAPLGSDGSLPHPGNYNRKLQLRSILPEATTVVLPASKSGALIGAGDMAPDDVARRLVDDGAHSVWLRDDEPGPRTVDRLAQGGQVAILDYPFAGTDANAAGAAPALASLLARGLPLREAVEQAHRYETGIGTAVRVAAR